MPATKPPYPAEFKQQIIERVRAGRTPAEVGGEFKCSARRIATWVVRGTADKRVPYCARSRERDVLSSAEHEERACVARTAN